MTYENTSQLGHIARYNGLLNGCGSPSQLIQIIKNFLGDYAQAGIVKVFSESLSQSIDIKKGINIDDIKLILMKSDENLSVQVIDGYLVISSEKVLLILLGNNIDLLDTLADNIILFVDAVNLWLKRNDINVSTDQSLKQSVSSLSFSISEVENLTQRLTSKGEILIKNTLNLSFDQISLLEIDDYEEKKLKILLESCGEAFSEFLQEIKSFNDHFNDNLKKTKAQLYRQQLESNELEVTLCNIENDYSTILF